EAFGCVQVLRADGVATLQARGVPGPSHIQEDPAPRQGSDLLDAAPGGARLVDRRGGIPVVDAALEADVGKGGPVGRGLDPRRYEVARSAALRRGEFRAVLQRVRADRVVLLLSCLLRGRAAKLTGCRPSSSR